MPILPESIFSISYEEEFNALALRVFQFQANYCNVYADFLKYLNIKPDDIAAIDQIPFLPVEFFKTHRVSINEDSKGLVFSSSGTTGSVQSRHYVSDPAIYEQSYRKALSIFYGDIRHYAVLALLPSYQEREGSSLIYMVDELIKMSSFPQSGYFLHNHDELYDTLNNLKELQIPTILIGVTYALLDFAEHFRTKFPGLIVMETGGMKGKRKEMIREELHQILCEGFGVQLIHSEYGMTELLSQAYSQGSGIFHCPPWMQIRVRDINDPLTLIEPEKTGGINIVDLANINSCSFIATQDLGKLHTDGTFEILGRFDNSDIRGCNLLVQ